MTDNKEFENIPADNSLEAIQSPMAMMIQAKQAGFDMSEIKEMMDLQDRNDQRLAKQSFNKAVAAFKAEDITIKKDKTVIFEHKDGRGQTVYDHATLGNIVAIAVPLMASHGLSHKWEAKREADRIEVRCILAHREGHSEATEWWPGPLDSSGSKNSIQQAASTVTYLERYTFLMITGLAVENQDDDGNSVIEYVSQEDAINLQAALEDVGGNKEKFLKLFNAGSFEEIRLHRLEKAWDAIEQKRTAQ